MKSVRNCRGLSFLRVAQNFLGSHLLLARSSKKSLLATRIIFTMELRRDLYFNSQSWHLVRLNLIQVLTLAHCKSDFTVNPGGVGFYRN